MGNKKCYLGATYALTLHSVNVESTIPINGFGYLVRPHHVRFGRGGRILKIFPTTFNNYLKRFSHGLLRSFVGLEEVSS